MQAGNTGPTGGHNTPLEAVVTYTPPNGIAEEAKIVLNYHFFPNPASGSVSLYITDEANQEFNLIIADVTGKIVRVVKNLKSNANLNIDLVGINTGMYFLKVSNGKKSKIEKLLIE